MIVLIAEERKPSIGEPSVAGQTPRVFLLRISSSLSPYLTQPCATQESTTCLSNCPVACDVSLRVSMFGCGHRQAVEKYYPDFETLDLSCAFVPLRDASGVVDLVLFNFLIPFIKDSRF